jgi:hypothetical protein
MVNVKEPVNVNALKGTKVNYVKSVHLKVTFFQLLMIHTLNVQVCLEIKNILIIELVFKTNNVL